METTDHNTTGNDSNDVESGDKKNRKTMYIIGCITLLVLIIVLVIILVIVLGKDNNSSSSLNIIERFDNVVNEIINDCEAKEQKGGNYSCANITASQRRTLSSIFSEFNEDGDDEWSIVEYSNFYTATQTSDDSLYFDELDVDNDGELDFMEVMASLKKQSEIIPDLFNKSYNSDVQTIYNMVYDLDDWKWFAYAADLFLQSEFGEVYTGYPNGIFKDEYMNMTSNQQFESYSDTDNDGQPDIDFDEFIMHTFLGYGLIDYVENINTKSVWDASPVNESVLEDIVDEINATYSEWGNGLGTQLSNAISRRRLADSECKQARNECRGEAMKQSEQLAGQDPSKNKGTMSKTAIGYIQCKNKECMACKSCWVICKQFDSKESYCMNIVNSNI
eukprot:536104_1